MSEQKKTEYYLADVKDLIPYARNARTHSDAQVAQIAASIKEFGFLNPVIITKDNTILAGHGRIRAAEKLGLEKVPCIREEYLTEAQKQAYIIADNKLSLNAGWDNEMLAVELQDLQGQAFDLSLLGFDDKELNALLSPNSSDIKEDDFDVDKELEQPCFSKEGDVWSLGRHKLVCGDCTKPETMALLTSEKTVDLYVTDPPYNVAIGDKGKVYKALGLKQGYGNTDRSILNDNMDDKSFREFLNNAFKCADSVMKDGAVFYIWHADSEGLNFRGACMDNNWQVRQCLIWKKNSFVIGRQDYQWLHEPCLYGWKNGASHAWYSDRKQSTVLEFDRPTKSKEHPTMKPLGLIGYLVANSSKTDDIVLDSFGGSGTTLMVCQQLNRVCRMTELDPKYCDVIVNRFHELAPEEKITLQREGSTMSLEEAKALIQQEDKM